MYQLAGACAPVRARRSRLRSCPRAQVRESALATAGDDGGGEACTDLRLRRDLRASSLARCAVLPALTQDIAPRPEARQHFPPPSYALEHGPQTGRFWSQVIDSPKYEPPQTGRCTAVRGHAAPNCTYKE